MIHLHVTKEVFEKIKIYLGYPKKTDKEKIIFTNCKIFRTVKYKHLIDPLFIKYYPEYKDDEKVCVYCIELGNLK